MHQGQDHPLSPQDHLERLYQALVRVPCGTGDHTDLCRMHNQGLPPLDHDRCRCHVGIVRTALADYRAWKQRNLSHD